jgi:pyruvate/2-oxoglutarate dehydrogenase complex dihydrolipoamide acyltransferase (E2) component
LKSFMTSGVVATGSAHLAIPALKLGRRADVILQWLKRAGDEAVSLEPIARLVGDHEWLLLVPNGYSGRLGELLASSGEPVVPCEPVVKILVTAEPQDEGEQNANGELSEAASPFADAPPPHRAIVARIMPSREVTLFAWIGALSLVGILLAASSMIASAFLGGPLPALFGGFCLAIVAGALAYGRRRLG